MLVTKSSANQGTDLLVSEEKLTSGDFFCQFLAQTSVKELELCLRRKNGTILPVLINATIIQDAQRGTVLRTSFLILVSVSL
jgi:hypothetical protein